jgi:hypothetical protein
LKFLLNLLKNNISPKKGYLCEVRSEIPDPNSSQMFNLKQFKFNQEVAPTFLLFLIITLKIDN